ncbi:RagB/SusD family nutrient uptake outer membrane protein [Alistipes sp.]|uniref:RagB/SusD family nutrient uptake outer membrane protein n=1 Tax=Alistipes sp. TaxID=1872444 RepID=UPI003AEF5603
MKKIFYTANKLVLLFAGPALLFSCNDYLDEMPDNRTELDNAEKISQILISAYSESLPVTMQEMMSDNVTDYGKNIDIYDDLFQQSYLMQDVTGTAFDTPSAVWNDNYNAVASANHALEAIEKLGDTEELEPQKGEALICRAYAHFTLCNAFCQAYNPQSSKTDLGIPYVTKPETTVFVDYERGTVEEVYAKIAADIEAGIPLIDDTKYTQPKYHFTKKAAQAFAAQFYLYYGKYDKAIEYATAVLGEDPSAQFRNWDLFTGTSSKEYSNAYNASDEAANIFNQGFSTINDRTIGYRYIHTQAMLSETLRSLGPWMTASPIGTLPAYNTVYSYASRSFLFPKMSEYFMYTDVAQGIGHPYCVQVVYSTEKTLIDRAEAYAMAGPQYYDLAARDLNLFYASAGAPTAHSAAQIASFYETAGPLYKREIAPRFTVEAGTQTNLIHACLHARRIVTIHEGTRLQDLKRFGIAYTHFVDGAANIEVAPYDKRLAIQLPATVIAAGLEANPR